MHVLGWLPSLDYFINLSINFSIDQQASGGSVYHSGCQIQNLPSSRSLLNQVPFISYRLRLKNFTKSFLWRFFLLEKAALGMEIVDHGAAPYLVEVQLSQLQRSLVGCSPQPLQQAPQLLRR